MSTVTREVRVRYRIDNDLTHREFERRCLLVEGYSTDADIPVMLGVFHFGYREAAEFITVVSVTGEAVQ